MLLLYDMHIAICTNTYIHTIVRYLLAHRLYGLYGYMVYRLYGIQDYQAIRCIGYTGYVGYEVYGVQDVGRWYMHGLYIHRG